MKRINKILILFLFVLSLSFFAVWEVLQSNWVASQVSKVATNYIEEVLNAEVEFNNLKFNLFPPGAEVRNVLFKGKQDNKTFFVEAASLGVFFNPFDVFKTDFIADNIVIDDAIVRIVIPDKPNTKQSTKKKQTFNLDAFDLLKDIPVNRATIKDVKLQLNNLSVFTTFFELKNNRKNLSVHGDLLHFNIDEVIKLKQKIDRVSIKAVIDREIIDVEYIKLNSNLLSSRISGTIKNYVSENISYNLKTSSKVPLNHLHDWVEFKQIGTLDKGIGEEKSIISGQGEKFQVITEIKLKKFKTDFAYGENARIKVNTNNDRIVFKEVIIEDGNQKINLLKEFEFYNFKTKKFVEEPILANVTEVEMNNLLRYLRSSLSLLDGSLTGKIKFDLKEKSFSFVAQEPITINRLSLKAGKDFEILKMTGFIMERGSFVVDRGTFKMDVFARNGESNFSLNARINKNEFELRMPTSYIELDKLEHIVGHKLGGKGTFSFDMYKGDSGVILSTENDFKGFSFDGYFMDKVKAKVNYHLDENEIVVKKLNAASGQALIYLDGKLNYKTLAVESKYKINKMNFNEVKKVLRPVFDDISITSNEIHGDWDLNGKISGLASVEDLVITGNLSGRNNYFFDENLDRFKFKYLLQNSKFSINDFKATKGKGKLSSTFSYDLKSKDLQFSSVLDSISIQDFSYYSKLPLSLQSDLDGKLWGRYYKGNWSFGSNLILNNSRVFSQRYPNSKVKMNYDMNDLKLDLNIFSGKLVLDSNFAFGKESKSKLNLDINFDNIKDFLGLFSGIDLINSDVSGALKYKLVSEINSNTFQVINMESNLKYFNLDKLPISVKYQNAKPEFIIRNGLIEKWKMNVRGRKFYVLSNGEGTIGKDYETITQLKIDASFIEIFNNIVTKANGNIRGKVAYGQKKQTDIYEAYLASSNLTLTSKYLPTSITKADMKISFKDKVINFEKFNAHLISGTFGLSGKVSLDSVIPDINLRYEFKDSGLTVLKKSSLVFSGSGSLIGKNFPYTLGGDFHIQKFNIINELTDFGFGGSGFSSTDIDYLPGRETRINDQLLNFNLNVVTREPIFIRNSLADLGFVGNLQILGGEKDPRLSGNINMAPRNNKVAFKNNEFNFSKGNIVFSERNSFKNPELDFLATSAISNYKVNVSLVGPVKNFDFNLTSEPTLEQSDILSLIAFGYTEDLSNNLSDAEKESMTRAGVGSIIFDSFKINETLKNEFGLQVNLGTEISKEEGSNLSSRNSDGGNNVGRVRSATTFEVKKKLDDDMSMSVSSTVGSSSTQKQSFNLNYNLNNNVSVEGVYESKASNDEETINDDTSFGADVKWKWSFK
jgi:translocation and assembly module TamB